jgi:hypothetical protein
VPNRLHVRQAKGRWWRRDPGQTEWHLQCTKCARFKTAVSFETLGPKLYGPHCRQCRNTMPPTNPEPTRNKGRGARLRCKKCRETQDREHFLLPTGQLVAFCATCRTLPVSKHASPPPSARPMAPIDRAYRALFPDYADYGNVPGTEILAHPDKYPGRTYFHLTRAERDRAVSLAKDFLLAEQGVDYHKHPALEPRKESDRDKDDDDDSDEE